MFFSSRHPFGQAFVTAENCQRRHTQGESQMQRARIRADVQSASLQDGGQPCDAQAFEALQAFIVNNTSHFLQARLLAGIRSSGGDEGERRVCFEKFVSQFRPILQRPFFDRRTGADGEMDGTSRDI